MERVEKLCVEWLKQHGSRSGHDLGVMAALAFEAGYLAGIRDAAIRGRLAQLEDKVVDIEILALVDQEDTDASGK